MGKMGKGEGEEGWGGESERMVLDCLGERAT